MQVNVAVILRQNMRQKTQTAQDTKFRTALENMRYSACTEEDIAFLRAFTIPDFRKKRCLLERRNLRFSSVRTYPIIVVATATALGKY